TLLAPERYPAVITNVHCNGDTTVEVYGAGMRMQVAVHPDVDSEQLKIGARGLLSKSRNCLLSVEESGPSWHDIGTFEGYAGERRMRGRHQEQVVAADVADDLLPVELHKGDLVGFDREGAHLAYSRVEPPGKEDLFFENTPADRFEELGGLDREIERLKRAV